MKKTLYFISDMHGNYDATIKALKDSKYDENNPNHLLIVLGDFTDRGTQSLALYKYLYRLTKENKAIVIAGNHTLFFIKFLRGSVSPFNYINNGLRETIADFWHRTAPFESWCLLEGGCDMTQESYVKWAEICRNDINEEYPELLPWLESLPRYFESKHYIGVHGAIDTKVDDWHHPHCLLYNFRDWDALDFNDGSFFGEAIKNTDKTVVIGHFATAHLREMYGLDFEKDPNEILYRDDGRVIAIDTCTIRSNRVNVLAIEDELL
jgi:serine/threonine protein phosphatase 1